MDQIAKMQATLKYHDAMFWFCAIMGLVDALAISFCLGAADLRPGASIFVLAAGFSALGMISNYLSARRLSALIEVARGRR